jgi:hypothetical protein
LGARRGFGRGFGMLLRLALGAAAAAAAAGSLGARPRRGPDVDAEREAEARAGRCRLAAAEIRAERAALAAEILRHGEAREILAARLAAEPEGPGRDELARSLGLLEDRLLAWLDERDALGERLAELEDELAFLDAAARGDPRPGFGGPDPQGADPDDADPGGPDPVDPETARHLAALGLASAPPTLAGLKAAYRARLKAVHPDVGATPSTAAAARATVAFAELRRRYPAA